MRKLKYIEPKDPANDDWSVVEVIVTEEDVRRDYYPYWCERMKSLGRENMINFEACWIDYKVVNWAEEIS